jgi:hypothetical protein
MTFVLLKKLKALYYLPKFKVVFVTVRMLFKERTVLRHSQIVEKTVGISSIRV